MQRPDLLLALGLLALSTALPAQSRDPSPPWTRVEMKASKLFITTTSTVEVRILSSREAREDLLPAPERQPLPPAAAKTALVTTGNSLMGRDSVTRLWLDPGDGRALQRIKVETGKKHRYKAERFTPTGVLTLRRYPLEGEEKNAPATWGKNSEEFVPAALGEQSVIEPGGLLYLLAVAPLNRTGDTWSAAVYADDAVHRLEVRVEAVERRKASYVEVRGKREDKRRGEVEVLHLSLRPKAGKAAGDSQFEFLGLEGDVDVYLHRKHRYPIRISGKIPIAGRVNIELQKVVLGGSRP